MRPAAWLFLALLAGSASMTGANGQSSSVWMNSSDQTRYAPERSDRRSLELVHRSARCVVERNRSAVANMLGTVPESDDEARLLWGPVRSRLQQCAGAFVQMSSLLLRGILAEALYERDFGALPRSPQPLAVGPIEWPSGHRTAPSLAPVYELGRCVVAAGPEPVAQLLAAEPFSAEERQKLRELGPRLPDCLDRGSSVETNRETLRAVLAESLYRWAARQAPSTANRP